MTLVAATERLRLCRFDETDAAFVLQLVNEPSWLQYIGDKNVRTLDDARAYLVNGPLAMYERCGHGLYRVDLKDSGEAIGMCGLIRRDTLPDVDIGYAFLPAHWGRGYAEEATRATLAHAREIGLRRLLAIVTPGNERSIRLLDKLGLRYECDIEMRPGDVTAVFAADLAAPP
ncbi:MAG TPA: GNAT family N-acetyltransferase [Tahibacter sp.]|uniref:GNAT family N-acetyltransferase n=1 Tax=Tahibacter sp. TaxID=2056211 RepID=UPI002CD85942|nr:GNAT family N-acetyltransferase [Tahibacter sp.]HSX60890.1 GNAT family N-acetyltransferase [Tahibacter sp.]